MKRYFSNFGRHPYSSYLRKKSGSHTLYPIFRSHIKYTIGYKIISSDLFKSKSRNSKSSGSRIK